MNILILTGYDDNIKELGEATDVSKRAYAELHGYDFHVKRDYITETHPSWQKIQAVRDRLRDYDAVVWFDSDTVITNPDIKIEDIISDRLFTVSHDWCAPPNEPHEDSQWISCGNFIVRNHPDADRWLEKED